jgi:hypothetical protein
MKEAPAYTHGGSIMVAGLRQAIASGAGTQEEKRMSTLIVLFIGIFIGWNLPQPPWAKSFQDGVVRLVRSLTRGPSSRP